MNKIIITTLFFLNCAFLCMAQVSYPTTIVKGNDYYEYTVVAGDGLYSISKRFGVTQTELHEANEGLTTNIKIGQKILIPIKKEVKKYISENATIHTVLPKQTLYSISKLYGVSIDSLIQRNPGSENGIKIGDKLLIANEQVKPLYVENKSIDNASVKGIKHFVKKKETLYSISKRYNVAIHDLIAANPGLENGLKAGSTIIISTEQTPLVPVKESLTKEIKTVDEMEVVERKNKRGKKNYRNKKNKEYIESTEKNEIKEEINSIVSHAINGNKVKLDTVSIDSTIMNLENIFKQETNVLNIAYLLPLVAENEDEVRNCSRFVEFYKGSLLALRQSKEKGLSANVHTFNTGKGLTKIYSILDSLEKIDIDIIIGPAYSNQIDTVISYAKGRNIVSVIPFSSKIDKENYYSKLIQFNPPQDTLFSTILENTFAPRKRKYVIGRFEGCNNKGNILADELCRLLTLNEVEYSEYNIKPEFVDSIVSTITNDSTLLMLASTSIADVAPVLDSLHKYNLPNVEVWGFEEWGTNLIKKFPRTIFYSLFNPQPTRIYMQRYEEWFGPYKHTNEFKYDLIGYDLTHLSMCNILFEKNGLDFNITDSSEFMQSFPMFKFIENRWLNTNYYLFCWDNILIKEIDK